MAVERVLVVDGEPIWREVLAQVLERKGFDIALANDPSAAMRGGPYDALVADAAHASALSTIGVPFIATGALEEAIPALEAGAADFLVRPLTGEAVSSALSRLSQASSIIAESPAMKQILAILPRIAASSAPVLITGESGTGKELIAAEIHRLSKRNPYIRVNCAAIPENLVESEFFGHEKGAFTGATSQRQGYFERAHRGTLLLDEITEFPLHLQAKLLRALQEGEFERVGGSRPVRVDVRILATSNRDIGTCLVNQTFRADLFYRLAVLPIHLPPLRERPEDLHALLTGHNLSEPVIEKFTNYSWPGNVRELLNTLERITILGENST